MGVTSEASFFKSIFQRTITPSQEGNSYFYPVGMESNPFGGNSYLKDFQEIPELNAILNIRSRAMSSWKLSIQSKTTGADAAANESLVRILRSPNWFQGQGELWKQSSLFRDLYGNEYLYFLKPIGMTSTYKGLFTINPANVRVKYNSTTLPFQESTNQFVQYFYEINGKVIELEKENIIHLNDNRVDPKKFLEGTSKLQALQAPIQNIREAYRKRNIILKMPVGIMSNGQNDAIGQGVPMNPQDKKEAQNALRNHGALPILTDLTVKYNDMNVNAQSMGLFEEVREDVGRICDSFGVPYELLANQKGTTFTNLKEAKKQMYEESIIPDAQEKVDALNLQLGIDKKSWHIVADFSHLPIFAEDQKQRAISLKQMVEALSKALADGAITIQQYQNELLKFGI